MYYKANDVYENYCDMIVKIINEGTTEIKQKGGKMQANFIPRIASFEKRKFIMKKIYESFYKVSFFGF